jgi:hypothetical protein
MGLRSVKEEYREVRQQAETMRFGSGEGCIAQ